MSILRRGLTAARSLLSSAILLLILSNLVMAGPAPEPPTMPQVHEQMWGIPSSPVPIFLAYLIRPLGDGPFPLVVMNHGVSLDLEGAKLLSSDRIPRRRTVVCATGLRGEYALDTVRLGSKSPSEVCSVFFSRAWENVRIPNFVRPGLPVPRSTGGSSSTCPLSHFIKRGDIIVGQWRWICR